MYYKLGESFILDLSREDQAVEHDKFMYVDLIRLLDKLVLCIFSGLANILQSGLRNRCDRMSTRI